MCACADSFTTSSVRLNVDLLLPEIEDGEGRVGLAVEGAAFERRYLVVLESQTWIISLRGVN